ncbi:SAM-dependent methyltransferase [Soehngenia longivitae]|uniref:SAM-dependent methyltransferase n=1 Tax=Soehngenia longivitae TaxID=2562294 RepID=A0A4Z0D5H8_9FIRM|nr:class I SAM-dependent methyltransferase [Soehngenia longivitae]TFZ40069.1 SAM-dependent methyltransferase [Soehngenia longivitae]
MRLSKRLQSIVSLVPDNSIVADIGTDHGYVPFKLIESGKSKRIIATDISNESLNKTISYIKQDLLIDGKIVTRVGNGLVPIKPFEVDTVIIAGMGGILISDILKEDIKKTDSFVNFILQPMVASTELRVFLNKNGFEIIDEDLVAEDGFIYEVIYAKRGLELIADEIYFEIGRKLIQKRHPLLNEFISKKIEEALFIISELDKHLYSPKAQEKRQDLEKKIAKYKEVLQCL